jgi:hypothetical protein
MLGADERKKQEVGDFDVGVMIHFSIVPADGFIPVDAHKS